MPERGPVPDIDLIHAARWAAIELVFPAITSAAHRGRRWRRAGWQHTYDSAGGIHSERPRP